MLSPHLDTCALRMAQVRPEKDHHLSTSAPGNQRRDHLVEERCAPELDRGGNSCGQRLVLIGVFPCVCSCVFLGFNLFTDSAAGRINPFQPTTRVIPMRSGDFELHGTTDKRANTRATTSETGVPELSHGDRTSGPVVHHNYRKRLAGNLCSRPGPGANERERQYSLRMHALATEVVPISD